MPPAADRTGIQRLTHLPLAGGQDFTFGLMEIQAGGVPVQAQEVDHAPALALQVTDHVLIMHLQDPQRPHAEPMLHQARDLSGPGAAVKQIEGPRVRILEVLEIAGQPNVAQVAPAQDDPRPRKQCRNLAEDQNIVGKLIDHAIDIAADGPQAGKMILCLVMHEGCVPQRGWQPEVAFFHPLHNVIHMHGLADAVDPGVACGDLLDQGCAGSRHANDEDRDLRRIALQPADRQGGEVECGDLCIDFAAESWQVECAALVAIVNPGQAVGRLVGRENMVESAALVHHSAEAKPGRDVPGPFGYDRELACSRNLFLRFCNGFLSLHNRPDG